MTDYGSLQLDILEFWFERDPSKLRKQWFVKSAAFDHQCMRFIDDVRSARAGQFDHWAETPKGGLALVILLDQLSRHVFRGSAEAFAADPHAHHIARSLIAAGADALLTPVERMFVYLPFQHAETKEDQDISARLFESLSDVLGNKAVEYAHRHRDLINRFGRFPQRNAALGRLSTLEEQAFLAQPSLGF